MLLGRTFNKCPAGTFNLANSNKRRILFVQSMVDTFWKKWTTFYFSSLIIRKKWHHEQRNAAVDDVVIIYDKDLTRWHWKIGVISKIFHGIDKRVRYVLAKYKNHNSSVFTEVERPVQKLVILLPIEESH